MALVLLDGTAAAFDFTTSGLSWKCWATYATARINRQFFDQTTFCSGTGWVSEIPGKKQAFVHLEGFVGKGSNAANDPMYFFTANATFALVFTYDTGCTISGSFYAENWEGGIRAGQNSNLSFDARSAGAVTTAWVIA